MPGYDLPCYRCITESRYEFFDKNRLSDHLRGDNTGAGRSAGLPMAASFIDAVLAHLNHGDYLGNCDTLTIITSQEQPAEFKLYANYPNPFNPVTNIRFNLPQTSHAKLTIYDVL